MSEELLAAAVRLAIPILLAALGELVAQRAGVINIGVEGMMLGGAFAAAAAAQASGSAWVGLGAGVLAGVSLAAVFAAVALLGRGDSIVAGTGLNLLAIGVTGYLYRLHFARTPLGLQVAGFVPTPVPLLSSLPLVGEALFVQPMTAYLAYVAVPMVWLGLTRSGLGLRLRGAGEAPEALRATGASVTGLRSLAVAIGGGFAGAGGAALVLGHAGTFVEGMTSGRGFIALALVICAAWTPLGVLLAAGLFGLAMALGFEAQAAGAPDQLARVVPYAATLVVLTLAAGSRWRAPASLGR